MLLNVDLFSPSLQFWSITALTLILMLQGTWLISEEVSVKKYEKITLCMGLHNPVLDTALDL